MDTMRSGGKRRADIELEVKQNEEVYEKIDKKNVNNDIYENLKTEKKTKTNSIRHEDIDKIKVVTVLLCVVVAALVVAAVTVSSVVFFGVTDGGWRIGKIGEHAV
ncbi:uncharacterized protein LOC123545588 [Mercenaria mercenaria]|uniref:uncharacterized protein LOC123545588 n=1 Tax=Mercenaria mercenaria TaxID=6596 RepID=UPI00234EF854|nr:uncharacterized protein LOC123545588 [Mercenaria mercenaria]